MSDFALPHAYSNGRSMAYMDLVTAVSMMRSQGQSPLLGHF